MTVICAGGTSALKPGVGAQVVVGAALVSAGLDIISPWLIPISALVDGFVYDALSACPSDPPPMPVFDATDAQLLAIGLLAPNAQQTLTKIHDALLNYCWYQFCECTTGPQPTLPPPVPNPTGTFTGSGTGTAPVPCFSGSTTYLPDIGSPPPYSPRWDITTQLLPTDGTTAT